MSSLFVCLFTTRKYLTTCFLPSNYFYYFFLFQFVLLASLSASFLSRYCQEVWIKSSACKSKTHEDVNNVSTHSNLSIISAQSFLFISTSNSWCHFICQILIPSTLIFPKMFPWSISSKKPYFSTVRYTHMVCHPILLALQWNYVILVMGKLFKPKIELFILWASLHQLGKI